MSRLLIFNKPFDVLSQFTDRQHGRATLADYLDKPGFYPAGRLDRDSEGLLLLTDDGAVAYQLTHPRKRTWKTYWVQVEGDPSAADLTPLRQGIQLKDGPTLPAHATLIDEPALWPRNPPIRFRASIPTRWLEIRIREGRNRQVRRMTAAIGYPTLRLVRQRVGNWSLDRLLPGQYRELEVPTPMAAIPAIRRRGAQRTRPTRRH